MTDTEFWRDLKPITSVFKADALPEVYLEDAPPKTSATTCRSGTP